MLIPPSTRSCFIVAALAIASGCTSQELTEPGPDLGTLGTDAGTVGQRLPADDSTDVMAQELDGRVAPGNGEGGQHDQGASDSSQCTPMQLLPCACPSGVQSDCRCWRDGTVGECRCGEEEGPAWMESSLLGRWVGLTYATNQDPYPVEIELLTQGHYASRCVDGDDTCSAFFFGDDYAATAGKYWHLNYVERSVGVGEIQVFRNGAWLDLQEVELDSTAERLRLFINNPRSIAKVEVILERAD